MEAAKSRQRAPGQRAGALSAENGLSSHIKANAERSSPVRRSFLIES